MSNSDLSSAWQIHNAAVISCCRCSRLVAWREEVAREKRRAYRDWEYWGNPVPAFGDPAAHLMVVGLAPGAHGSNRTGRMFTGDSSGDFLYAALHRAGFSSQPGSTRCGDGLELHNLLITACCRCVPPGNKPTPEEILACRPFLLAEMEMLPSLQGLVALGRVAFDNILTIYRQRGLTVNSLEFGHGAFYRLGDGLPWLMASYHPSRQNTQTGRLTPAMFDVIWERARDELGA